MQGVPGVLPEKLAEGMEAKHCALSLVGEPIMYPGKIITLHPLPRDRRILIMYPGTILALYSPLSPGAYHVSRFFNLCLLIG